MNGSQFRERVLAAYGAGPSEAAELLAYNQNVFDRSGVASLRLPLPDEPHVTAWRQYEVEAREVGVLEALRPRLVQLRFPIQEGISETDDYLAAVRRGVPVRGGEEGKGLDLRSPETLRLVLHPTPAGTVPVLIAPEREDFVSLVRALAMRNEPGHVPASMGACIIGGLVNWDRVDRLRRQWETQHPFADPDGWASELARITPHRELYQDRLILLSVGPYSGVPAADMGMAETEWRDLSLTIRLEHECTHYFTRRVFASMRNNLLDELIADYRGIVEAAGSYRADWFLRFVGLSTWPTYRLGSRLENYRGEPPLSDRAFTILQALVHDAARNLERFDPARVTEAIARDDRARTVLALTCMTLEELASDEAEDLLDEAMRQL